MKEVTAKPAEGAWVRGPCKVRLSKTQHARRVSVLGEKYPRGGVFKLDGGQAINFKKGETFSIDAPGRLNKAIFEWDQPEAAETISGTSGDDTLAGASGDDTLEDASGDDTLETASGDDTVPAA